MEDDPIQLLEEDIGVKLDNVELNQIIYDQKITDCIRNKQKIKTKSSDIDNLLIEYIKSTESLLYFSLRCLLQLYASQNLNYHLKQKLSK